MRTLTRKAMWGLLLGLVFLAAWKTLASDARAGLLASDIAIAANPSGLAPLTAVARFKTSPACRVRVKVEGDIEVEKDFPVYRTEHSLPILGLYPDRENTVVITLFSTTGQSESHSVSIATAPLPDFLPRIDVQTAQPDRMEPGLTLCDLAVTNGNQFEAFPIMFDHHGVIRWYLDLSAFRDFCPPMERLRDGNLLFAASESIYEYTMLGELARKITVPGYNFHHDIVELPYGFFLAAVDKPGTTIVNSKGLQTSVEDHIIEVNRRTGAVFREWDLRQILDVSRNEFVNSAGDWFHMNAVWYSPADDCLIVSGRTQGVVKISRKNGLKWILAPHAGWGDAGPDGTGAPTANFLLTAVDAAGVPYESQVQDGFRTAPDFDWPWAQHASMILPNGNLFLFDNGAFRNFGTGNYSRAVEYQIDETAMTVRQVWTYGQERGPDMYSFIISDVDYLPQTENRLITAGIVQLPNDPNTKIIELAYPGKEVVFEATLHLKNLRGLGKFTQGGFDMIYRSERLSIYPF